MMSPEDYRALAAKLAAARDALIPVYQQYQGRWIGSPLLMRAILDLGTLADGAASNVELVEIDRAALGLDRPEGGSP